MDFSKYEDKKWFVELKKNVDDYNDKNNAIESAKFGYERDIKMPQWVLGIGITLLLVSKGIVDNLEPSFKEIGFLVYLMTAIILLYGMINVIRISQRQRIGMMYVYREKDKWEKGRINSKKR